VTPIYHGMEDLAMPADSNTGHGRPIVSYAVDTGGSARNEADSYACWYIDACAGQGFVIRGSGGKGGWSLSSLLLSRPELYCLTGAG